jgi:amidase
MASDDEELAWLGVHDLKLALAEGRLTTTALTAALLRRIEAIDQSGPTIRSIIEMNPEVERLAAEIDAQPNAGPLRGIPVVVKDNIDSADAMHTTAGSWALVANRPVSDAPLVTRLRDAGALILGKANLSEWANFRSTHSSSGWSARGGLTLNPHAVDRSAGGSSSGSAAAVAAGLAPLAVGTETDGSILCPAALCGVVGIKPTVGLISRTGVIPIAESQDTPGPIARTVYDAAALLTALAGTDPADPATIHADGHARDYTQGCVDNGLGGLRIGIARKAFFGHHPGVDLLAESAISRLSAAGATVVDGADITTATDLALGEDEITVLLHEVKAGLDSYLATRPSGTPRTLAEVVEFNRAHTDIEMPHFGQEWFELALEKGPLTDPAYLAARDANRTRAREQGIDAALTRHEVDCLVMPTYGPAWKIDLVNGDAHTPGCAQPAAVAGYPAITVPMGFVEGLPVGLCVMGTAWSEVLLIRVAYVLERRLGLVASGALRPAYRGPLIG